MHSFLIMICLASLAETINGLFSSTYVKLNITNNANNKCTTICANVQPHFYNGTKLGSESFIVNETQDDLLLCSDTPLINLTGQIIVDGYPKNPDWVGNRCTKSFYDFPKERILRMLAKNASAVLFRKDNLFSSFYLGEFQNDSVIQIPIFYINEYNYEIIKQLKRSNPAGDIVLRPMRDRGRLLSGSLVIILLATMFCIMFGGIWSGHTRISLMLAAAERAKREEGESERDKSASLKEPQKPSEPLNLLSLGCLLVFVVGFLLLFYYFFNVMVWFIIVLFTMLSSVATYNCISIVLAICFGHKLDAFETDLGLCLKKISRCLNITPGRFVFSYREIITYIVSAAISITWCVIRKNPYSFILHNILSIMFCIHTIAIVRIHSLKWITALMSALLVYDLFMVFITPFFTSKGCSIMVEAVTGGACSQPQGGPPDPTKEDIPIVFRVPDFTEDIFSCYNVTTDLQYPPVILGFGDVILPGILIGFNYAFDLGWKVRPRLYFAIGVLGYFFGLLTTFAALVLMKMAQPALIYLVPFTLIPTHLLALCKGHWWYMWQGHVINDQPPESPRTNSANPAAKRATEEDDSDVKPLSATTPVP